MADFWAALSHHLSTIDSLTDLVGNRIYPNRLPDEQVTLPCGVYIGIPGSDPIRGHGEKAGLLIQRVQFDWYSTTHALSSQIEYTLFNAIDGTRGLWGDEGNQISVQSCLAINNPVDLLDPSIQLYRVLRDYSIMWKEKNS